MQVPLIFEAGGAIGRVHLVNLKIRLSDRASSTRRGVLFIAFFAWEKAYFRLQEMSWALTSLVAVSSSSKPCDLAWRRFLQTLQNICGRSCVWKAGG